MAVTEQFEVPISLGLNGTGPVKAYSVVHTGTGGALVVHSPAATNSAFLVGLVFSNASGGTITFASGSNNFAPLSIAANQGMFERISKEPILVTQKGEDLTFDSDVAITATMYVVEAPSLFLQ